SAARRAPGSERDLGFLLHPIDPCGAPSTLVLRCRGADAHVRCAGTGREKSAKGADRRRSAVRFETSGQRGSADENRLSTSGRGGPQIAETPCFSDEKHHPTGPPPAGSPDSPARGPHATVAR